MVQSCYSPSTSTDTPLTRDTFLYVLAILRAQSDILTVANLQQCSRSRYTIVTPYLYRHLTLDERCIDLLLGQALTWAKGEGYALFRSVRYGHSLIPDHDIKEVLDLGSESSIHHSSPLRYKINLSYVRRITLKYDADEPSELSWSIRQLGSLLSHYRNFTGQYLFPSLDTISCVGSPDRHLELGEIWMLLWTLSSPRKVCFRYTHPFLYSDSSFASLDTFDPHAQSIFVHSAMPSWIPRSYSDCRVGISYVRISCEENCDEEDHPERSCERYNREEIARWLVAGPRSNKDRWQGQWSVYTGGIHTIEELREIRGIALDIIDELVPDEAGWTQDAIENARLFIEGIRWIEGHGRCESCGEPV
uniref:F-box domain-containing protein n=1 Tax=Kwoniella bestiolae CBS 10118 TaxID=1296100 RepID=A0A1B9GDG9_9TREE|nr:hypothetical protein I302_00553 [Kwoniella bestiolae CBS 10118]OCF29062.1 hypothetical protein I302_00553 [Kwoniella bestiolae CBS 10118]